VSAAEAAADFAGVLYTDAPANGEADAVEAMDSIQLERNMLLTMPGGWKMAQVDPKQPVTTYGEFKREILNEISRCLNIPFNIAAGNSSGYNYASGRLDHQTYYKAIKVDRAHMEEIILDRILESWLNEWRLLKKRTLDFCNCRHVWFWDGQEHVDPQKEANAQAVRLQSRTTSLASEYAKQGKDWETELRQIAREKELMEELGIATEEIKQNEQEETDE
jgi:capsid protein